MTALDDAAQAVEDAREQLIGWTLIALPNEPGFTGAERLADTLIAAARHHDAETVRDLSRQGYSAQEAAKKIDPKEGP